MSRPLFTKIFIVTCSLFAISANAGDLLPIHAKEQPFQGLYAGLGLGGFATQFKTNTTTTLSFPSSAFFANSSNSSINANANVFGNFFIGYLYPVKNFYLGPEVYLNVGNPNFSNTQTAGAFLPTETLTTYTNGNLRTYEIGIDFRLGVSATPTTLVYALVGAAFNNMNLNSSSTISRPLLPLTTTVNASTSQSVVGLRVGAGMEQKLFPNLNLRVSYAYTSYPSKNISNTTAPDDSDPFFQLGPIANSTSSRVTNQAVWAALVYQLDDFFKV